MNSGLFKRLQKPFFAFVLLISFFIIITYMLSMALGILAFFSTTEGLSFSIKPIIVYPLLFADFSVTVASGLYFMFLWGVFAICFAAAWKYKENLYGSVRAFFSGTTKLSPFRNNLLAMPIITATLYSVVIILHYMQTQRGVPTGSPPLGDPFLDFLRFSQAPLVEEIVFRIIPIGILLVVYTFVVGKFTKPDFSLNQRIKTCVLAVLMPEKAKKSVGLKTISEGGFFGGIVWAEWLMVVLTALLFGVAHYFGGWGSGKISQAAISGLVFALSYLYYGVQAPILLHWYFNYYYTALDVSYQYYFNGIDLLSLSWLANIFLGMLMLAAMLIFGIIAIFEVFGKRKSETETIYEPSSIRV